MNQASPSAQPKIGEYSKEIRNFFYRKSAIFHGKWMKMDNALPASPHQTKSAIESRPMYIYYNSTNLLAKTV